MKIFTRKYADGCALFAGTPNKNGFIETWSVLLDKKGNVLSFSPQATYYVSDCVELRDVVELPQERLDNQPQEVHNVTA